MKRYLYILLISCFPLFGQTNYYIHPDSSYSSITSINAETLLGGDTVFIWSGQTWRYTTLNLTDDGSSGNPVVITAYGGGRAKLYGSLELSSFTNLSGNVYYSNTLVDEDPTNPPLTYAIGAGTIFFITDTDTIWGTHESNVASLSDNYDWTYSNDSIYFSYDGTITDVNSIEAVQAARGINIAAEYIEISYIESKFVSRQCIGTTIYPDQTLHGVEIHNCELAYSNERGGASGMGIYLFHSEMYIHHNNIYQNGRRNISINLVVSGDNATEINNVYVYNNSLHDGWHTIGVDCAIQGMNHKVNNINIYNNKIYQPDRTVLPLSLDGNSISCMGIFIENNGDSADVDTVNIYNNELRNMPRVGIMLNGVAKAGVVYNTISGATDQTANAFGMIWVWPMGYSGYTNVSAYIANNILYNFRDISYGLYNNIYSSGTTYSGTLLPDTIDHNYHYIIDKGNQYSGHYVYAGSPDGTSYRVYDSVAYRSVGYDNNGILYRAYPEFSDSITNLSITSSSPVIGKGMPITKANGFWMDITTDLEGNPRDETTPDIGAYEYTSGGDTPSSSSRQPHRIGGKSMRIGNRTIIFKP